MTILNELVGGHRVVLDTGRQNTQFRVCCNGNIYATFELDGTTASDALKRAVACFDSVVLDALRNPKPDFK